MHLRGILPVLVGAQLALGVACTTDQPQPTIEDPPYGNHDDLVRLAVTPAYVNFGTEDSTDLTVMAEYQTGGEVDVTGQVDWVVGNEAVATMDGASAIGEGVGLTHVYATFANRTSNSVTIEVGYFTYTVECLDGQGGASQGEMVLCEVEIDGRELNPDHPEYITFEIEGFVPFGHDRMSLGLDTTNYFWVDDENTFKALFLIPPSLPAGEHDVTFELEGIGGEGDSTFGIAESSLPEKNCGILTNTGILPEYDERKFWVVFDQAPIAHVIETTTSGSELDTALWLFDDEGNLFTWTDNPRTGGTDAQLPLGITEDSKGEYFVVMTASPYAQTGDNETGFYAIGCDQELVGGVTIPGEQSVAIPNNTQPIDLDVTVAVGATDVVDHAWVHVDLETDVPDQVSFSLIPADPAAPAVGLRSTGYDAERLATTWTDDLVPPDSGNLFQFLTSDPNGTWTLQVTDFSAAGTTVVHDWRLYLETSPP